MRRLHLTSIFLIVAALLGSVPARGAEPIVTERIVAVVNNEVILLSEAKDRAALLGQTIDEGTTHEQQRQAEQQLRQVVDRMVEELLVLQQASELKLTIENAEIDRAAEEVRKQNNFSEEQFKEVLAQQGYSLEAYRRELEKQLLRFKVINTAVRSNINVSDEDVRAFYEQTSRQAGGNNIQVHLRHILIAVPAGADEKVIAERRAVATQVLEEARSSKDFAAVARKHSEDVATREEGGDLGWVNLKGDLPPVLTDVLATMDPGEVRGPIRTENGFDVVLVVAKRDADMRPFDEVKEHLRQQLSGQQLEKQTQSWLAELRRKSHVDIRL